MAATMIDMPVEMPARFLADRVFLDVRLASGDVLTLYTDTGGSLVLSKRVVDRLGLPYTAHPQLRDAFGPDAGATRMPPFGADQHIPQAEHDAVVATDMPDEGWEGLLGASWFFGHVWTWNYPAGTLRLEADSWRAPPDARIVPIRFKTDPDGTPNSGFPSFFVEIDGETLPMLFDTGAYTELTPEAHRNIGDDGPATRATSFVVASLFDRWRKTHPDWKVIDNGEVTTGSAMICVPNVRIAGFEVGPVWFTHRADRNFHEWMSQWMAERIDGAIGGNCFHRLIITVDYLGSRAYFQCPG